jgi:Co/Zn/Cd efflux system component
VRPLTLRVVLLLNAVMVLAEFSAGLVAGSTALLADSPDMLADATVYGLGLFALGRAPHWRARAALVSGLLQLALGLGVGLEAGAKLFADRLPDTAAMDVFGVIALLANGI